VRERHRYPKQWYILATACKDRAGWRCERCGIKQGTMRYSLRTERAHPVWLHAAHVHHDHGNPEPELMCVCPSCHWWYYRKDIRPEWAIERLKHQRLIALWQASHHNMCTTT
jgi:hypothetical protein